MAIKENRGRPVETPTVVLEKYEKTFYEVPTKPELGYKAVWYYDKNKTKNGPYKTEFTPAKGATHLRVKPEKGKAYAKQPVVMVFKTSERSNAQTKIKVFANENIDYIITSPKLVGVPDKAIILELGVGESLIQAYTERYNIN
jgi:hypothetical protein